MNGVANSGGALGDVIGDMFDIPEQNIVGQAEEVFTIGDTGKTNTQTTSEDDVWNPLGDF